MANSKPSQASAKPHPDYPLTPRGDCRWQKKVHGRTYYFTGTAKEALDEWLRVKDHLIAGREPPPNGSYVTVKDLVNAFLTHKKLRLDSSELARITWAQYERIGKLLVEEFGRTTAAEHLQTTDFQRLRARWAKSVGPITLGNRINVVRTIFNYGEETGLIPRAARYGVEFDKPSAKTIRKLRTRKGEQLFTAKQIKRLLAAAPPHMKAMILLAINGGLGNNDLAQLTLDSCDLADGWLDYPRPKTGMPRLIPLWPETVAAVQAAIKARPVPKRKDDAGRLFIGPRGSGYASETGGSRVAHEFANLCGKAGVHGRVFYDLRRTFETIADNTNRDDKGVKDIMGHVPESDDMAAVYRQKFFRSRLRQIVNRVRRWLFGR